MAPGRNFPDRAALVEATARLRDAVRRSRHRLRASHGGAPGVFRAMFGGAPPAMETAEALRRSLDHLPSLRRAPRRRHPGGAVQRGLVSRLLRDGPRPRVATQRRDVCAGFPAPPTRSPRRCFRIEAITSHGERWRSVQKRNASLALEPLGHIRDPQHRGNVEQRLGAFRRGPCAKFQLRLAAAPRPVR